MLAKYKTLYGNHTSVKAFIEADLMIAYMKLAFSANLMLPGAVFWSQASNFYVTKNFDCSV